MSLLIGGLMLFALFGGGFAFIVREDGWRVALTTFGITFGVVVWVGVAVWLMS